MTEQQPIKYADVIELGFERLEGTDGIFFDEYGYNYFIVRKILSQSLVQSNDQGYADEMIISAEWDTVTRTVRVIRYYNREGTIIGEIKIKSLKELKKAIQFYSD